MTPPPLRVAFMTGHDDDVVLDPSIQRLSRATRDSRWRGMQSDAAIVDAVATSFPHLTISTVTTVEELLATDAEVVVIISYRTQPSFAWYATFFEALRTLEARGVTVYPSATFKETISSKAAYTKLLQAAGAPLCPTAIVDRAECVSADGTLRPALVDASFGAALRSLGLLTPDAGASSSGAAPSSSSSSFHLVTKPSNADGGFGVAFWENAPQAQQQQQQQQRQPSLGENADVQKTAEEAAPTPTPTPTLPTASSSCAATQSPRLTETLQLRTMLSAGCTVASTAGGEESVSPLMAYLRDVGFVGARPHLLLQPLVPLLAQHYEIKIYFLQRKAFFASLVYGKEKLLAKVVRPSTDPSLFAYLEPLIDKSLEALSAMPEDGPHDPKILMRVDWGTGEPLLPAKASVPAGAANEADGEEEEEAVETADRGGSGASGEAFLKRALVKRAASLAAPQKKLKRSMESHSVAPLTGPCRHFINEVEIHPGYYVDWDDTPDETIVPLANAYGEYLTRLFEERRKVGTFEETL